MRQLPPAFAALAEAVEAVADLDGPARAWIAGRGLDPDRLHAAGWRSMRGADLAKLARRHGCAAPRKAARADLVLVIPVWDGAGRALSVRARPSWRC